MTKRLHSLYKKSTRVSSIRNSEFQIQYFEEICRRKNCLHKKDRLKSSQFHPIMIKYSLKQVIGVRCEQNQSNCLIKYDLRFWKSLESILFCAFCMSRTDQFYRPVFWSIFDQLQLRLWCLKKSLMSSQCRKRNPRPSGHSSSISKHNRVDVVNDASAEIETDGYK